MYLIRLRLLGATFSATLVCCALALLVASAPSRAAFSVGVQSDNLLLGLPAQQQYGVDQLKAMGAKFARVTVPWNAVATGADCTRETPVQLESPTSACYDFSTLDSLVTKAHAARIQLMFSVDDAPKWVNGVGGAYVGRSNHQFNATVAKYVYFLRAIGKRYNRASSYGWVRYWTIWNEPNSHTFFAPFKKRTAPQRYAYMLTKGAQALHAVNKGAKVAAGPTGPNSVGMKPAQFIKAMQPFMRRYRTRRFIQAWAHNPYPSARKAPGAAAFRYPSIGLANIGDLFTVLDSDKSTKHLQVWATEFAYQTRPQDRHGVTYAQQAQYLADCFELLWKTHRVPIAMWYVLQDPPAGGLDWHSGLINNAGVAKPSLNSFHNMLGLSTTVALRGEPITVWGRSATRPRSARIWWSKNGRTHWRKLRGVHVAGGTVNITFKASRTMYLELRDGKQHSPKRKLRVKAARWVSPAQQRLRKKKHARAHRR